MIRWLRSRLRRGYERHLERSITDPPEHVAVIQDGNRRYARERGHDRTAGHRDGAKTTEQLLEWCQDFGIQELTLYAFSTENFERPPEEREAIFDLIEEKLYEFADSTEIHDNGVTIRAIGDIERLPERVRDAVAYAECQTDDYDRFVLNVALAYGGRATLLSATRELAREAADSDLDPEAIDVRSIEERLYDRPVRDVDLIIRTGGDHRTSNFLPWHANGNEAAVFFCAPYWPSFSRVDFLLGLRTYEHREESWRRTRARRSLALLRALGDAELDDARETARRFVDALPAGERAALGNDDASSRRQLLGEDHSTVPAGPVDRSDTERPGD